MGTASLASDVCDRCWGSGLSHAPGVNLRAMRDEMNRLKRESSERWLRESLGANMECVRRYFPEIADKLERARWGADFGLNSTVQIVASVLRKMARVEVGE